MQYQHFIRLQLFKYSTKISHAFHLFLLNFFPFIIFVSFCFFFLLFSFYGLYALLFLHQVVVLSWVYGINRTFDNLSDMSIRLTGIVRAYWWSVWMFATPIASLVRIKYLLFILQMVIGDFCFSILFIFLNKHTIDLFIQ